MGEGYVIVPATAAHIHEMAPRVRAADRAEIAALGYGVEEGLLASLRTSLWARVALCRGRPICIWGLGAGSLLGGVGGPWMISTPLIERFPRQFLRESRVQVAEMLGQFPILRGVVDARYAGALRWMRWLGFEMSDPIRINGVPFHNFELRA